jgi:hypothetical protein
VLTKLVGKTRLKYKIMPQLDTVTFFNQLFWFTLVFFGFYFFVLGTIIPKLTLVLKTRTKKLQQDMSSSAALKAEATAIMGSYDKEFIALSSSLVSGVNTSLESRSEWLAGENKLSPRQAILPSYMNSLVQLFLKTRALKVG